MSRIFVDVFIKVPVTVKFGHWTSVFSNRLSYGVGYDGNVYGMSNPKVHEFIFHDLFSYFNL